MSRQFYYLLHLQFLGFRYHGWQKQPNVKTVHEMLDRTLNYVLDGKVFKTLGASRTDAMVSAEHAAMELFVREELATDQLLKDLNENLPNDIKVTQIEEVDASFNIIQAAKLKQYLYLFSFGAKHHPFCAPLMTNIKEDLDISSMMKGAQLFVGHHHLKHYCYQPKATTRFDREIRHAEIRENDLFQANFFPEKSFLFEIHGDGFMRHQVRLMMGALFALGKGEIKLQDIQLSLQEGHEPKWSIKMAPASGLMLYDISFEQSNK